MPASNPKVTFKDVDRIRLKHLGWSYQDIAEHLRCTDAYVRKTFYRQGWPLRIRPQMVAAQ